MSKIFSDADAHLVDFAAEFEVSGRANNKFIYTFAFGHSDISPSANALFYFGLNPQSVNQNSDDESYEVIKIYLC